MNLEARAACNLIRQAQAVTFLIHRRPDGDAFGSAWALLQALQDKKSVELVCATEIPRVFTTILSPIAVKHFLPADAELVVILDCAQLHRTGFSQELITRAAAKKPTIIIDHHPKGDLEKIATIYWQDSSVSATTELVGRCLAALRQPITAPIATSLLLGVYTDTGGFQHPNTSCECFKAAGRWTSLGGDLSAIARTLTKQRSLAKIRLWGAILANATINRFGMAVAVITAEHLTKARASHQDALGLVKTLSLIDRALAALVLVETETGWRASLRTRSSSIDLRRLARYFNAEDRGRPLASA